MDNRLLRYARQLLEIRAMNLLAGAGERGKDRLLDAGQYGILALRWDNLCGWQPHWFDDLKPPVLAVPEYAHKWVSKGEQFQCSKCSGTWDGESKSVQLPEGTNHFWLDRCTGTDAPRMVPMTEQEVDQRIQELSQLKDGWDAGSCDLHGGNAPAPSQECVEVTRDLCATILAQKYFSIDEIEPDVTGGITLYLGPILSAWWIHVLNSGVLLVGRSIQGDVRVLSFPSVRETNLFLHLQITFKVG